MSSKTQGQHINSSDFNFIIIFLYNLQKVGKCQVEYLPSPLPTKPITQELGSRKCNSRPSVVPLRTVGYSTMLLSQGLSTDSCKGQLTQVCPKDLSSTVNCRLLSYNAPHCQKTRSWQGGWWMETNLSTLMEKKKEIPCALLVKG